MKSKHLLLTLLMALLVPWAANAQETLTVNDGTTTNGNVPVYGFYADAYNKCEFVQPAADLAAMNGATINGVTFYASQSSVSWGSANFQVFLTEVGSTSISAFNGPGTVVYEGALSISGGTMTVNFTTPYTYNGGNLLVGVYQTTTGSYVTSTWYGVTATGASGSGYDYSSLSGCTFGQKNFLPKMTFVYEAAATGGCEKPETLTAVQPDTNPYHGVLLQWEGGSGTYTVQMKKSTQTNDEWQTKATGFTDYALLINGLDAETTYNFRVQSECGDEMSAWKTVNYTTPIACPVPTQVTVSNITTTTAEVNCTSDATEFNIMLGETMIENVTMPYTLTGLTSGTAYTVKVKAVCSDIDQSQWTSGTSFYTACEAITTFPWSEDFESYAAGNFTHPCWVNEHISGNGSSIFKVYTSTNGTNTTHQLQLPDQSDGTLTKLRLPEMILPDNYLFSIDVYRSSNYATKTGEGVRVYASTNGEIEGATELAFIPRYFGVECGVIPAEATGNTWYTYELPIGISGTCYIILRGENQYGTATYMDNFIVKEAPACPKPTGVTVFDVTAHEASVAWNSDASAFEIQLGEEQAIVVEDTVYHFTGLAPETTFAVKVRANCGGVYSDWANGSFTTAIACTVPTGVAVSNITGHGATITWAAVEGAWYQYAIVKTAEYNVDNIEWSESFEENTLTVNGLDPETGYTFALRKDCSAAEDGYSQIVKKTFTTTVACPAPTGLAAALTPGNGTVATLSWTSSASAWVVAYKTAEEEAFTEINVDENPYMLTGLTPETAYNAKVKAVCGGEDGESQWSSTITFTPTDAYMLTVNSGTSTNNYVPVYGLYVDNYSYSQFIIPATDLTAMEWGTINELTFYSSNANASWTNAKFEVYMTETTETTLSALADWTTMDKVMNEAHLEISGNQMVVTLDAPYDYMGGNLMVGIKQTVSGSYSSASFYGITATGASMGGYGSSVSQRNFLPKTTFAYEPGEAPACPKPTGLAVNYTGGITATVTWEGDATSYNIDVNGTVTEGVTSPYTLEGLELATTYEVMVQANCGEEQSEWTNAVSFTTDLCLPENQCEITFALTDSYGDSWNGNAIKVVDVATGTVLGQFANTEDAGAGEPQIYTLSVCDGREIQFVWVSGSYAYEASYVITDVNGEVIFEGSNALSAPVNYTVNCTIITCFKPKNLAVQGTPGKTSVVLNWTPGTVDQNAWRIAYMSENDSTYSYKNVTTHPYTLNGLTPETQYTVKVRANCGDGDYSDWSNEISFTTADACPADIYDLSASNITTHNALLSWSGDFESYRVRYTEDGGEWSEPYSTDASSIALSNLEAGTTYEYQVQGYCSDVDVYSEWVDGIQFETQSICGAPQNLYAVPGIDNATISWTGYQESYMVTFGETNETVVGTTYTITGLSSSTDYTVTVTGVGTECGQYLSATLEFTTGTGWDDPTIWAEPGVLNDGTVVVIEPGDEPIEIGDITVGEGSYIVIEPGAEVIYSGSDPLPVVLGFDDDDEDVIGPRCREELPGGYRLLASPVFIDETTQPYVTVESTHLMDGDDYFANDLYSFDVNYPAQEWRNYKEQTNNFVNFNWKQGYLYYGDYTKVQWTGNMVANSNNSKTIALDYNENHTYFPGANLIGNPFWAKGYPDMEFYVLNTEGNGVIASTDKNYVGKAKGFFVLAEGPGETCTVSTEAPVTPQSLNIALSQYCDLIDAAAIRFNDTKGLAKIQLNPNHTKIYMPFEGKDYAILQGEGLGEMPLNFEAEENGTYTLSFTNKEVNFSYLHLIDNLTGVETNLLANPSYSFEAKTTDYASRFRLVYATGSSVNGDNFGFINGMGNLCIFGIEGVATLQVMDVTGRILSTETFSGSYERKLNVAPGVYMLRLINGNDVKVQKIIVR